jgi:ATP-binding cassette subfamily B protein
LASIFLGTSYIIISRFAKKSLLKNSLIESTEQNKLVKILQEGLGGIREIILEDLQLLFSEKYKNSDSLMRKAAGNNIFLAGSPRYMMEVLGIILIACLALFFSYTELGLSGYIPILGTLAIASQRVLPAIQNGYASWAGFLGSSASLSDSLDLLEQKIVSNKNSSGIINFKKNIKFNNVGFNHLNQDIPILKNISFEIIKGKKIGIVGKTGSGKSTLLDILMGLLNPNEGKITIDKVNLEEANKVAWRTHFSHVPQNIFLLDASIEENISFRDFEKTDHEKVKNVCKLACLEDFIHSKKDGLKTNIGEKGIQISGGQKQRLGIARALYKDSPILIFDEATSALDNVTEEKLMNNILKSDPTKTIIMIAHRLTSIKDFDYIIYLDDGKILEKGSFKELMNSKSKFFDIYTK